MIGILSVGGHVPRYRLSGKALVVEGVLKATGRKREDIAKVVLYAPDARTHATALKQLKLPESAMPKESVIGRAGMTPVEEILRATQEDT